MYRENPEHSFAAMKTTCLCLALGATQALVPQQQQQPQKALSAKKIVSDAAATLLAGFTAVAPLSAMAITSDVRNQLSYSQTKGTGLANRCNEVKGEGSITVPATGYSLVELCLEPKTWQVEEDVATKKGDISKQFVNTKLMTRQTYT